jgi:hypothetical protein
MSMREVLFELPFPVEQRELVQNLIDANGWLLPRWVERIWVRFEVPPSASISTRMAVNEEYRSVRLSICPEWLLTDTPQIREADIRHEFLHASTDPLHRVARQLIELLHDSQLKDWATEELRLAVERTTADLEYAIGRGILQ